MEGCSGRMVNVKQGRDTHQNNTGGWKQRWEGRKQIKFITVQLQTSTDWVVRTRKCEFVDINTINDQIIGIKALDKYHIHLDYYYVIIVSSIL